MQSAPRAGEEVDLARLDDPRHLPERRAQVRQLARRERRSVDEDVGGIDLDRDDVEPALREHREDLLRDAHPVHEAYVEAHAMTVLQRLHCKQYNTAMPAIRKPIVTALA